MGAAPKSPRAYPRQHCAALAAGRAAAGHALRRPPHPRRCGAAWQAPPGCARPRPRARAGRAGVWLGAASRRPRSSHAFALGAHEPGFGPRPRCRDAGAAGWGLGCLPAVAPRSTAAGCGARLPGRKPLQRAQLLAFPLLDARAPR
nr:hypothetical protein [Tanacetum cinerariifolium]